jgi:SAM-dependent methyltransferase
MRQGNPHRFLKLSPNLADLREILRPEDSLLDAGCCEGHLYDELKHENYTGIDIVPEHISKAKSRNPSVRYEVGDILNLNETWDVVWCSRVLMHLPNYEKSVESLRKIARRKLIVLVPMWGRFTDIDKENGGILFRSFAKDELGGTEKVISHPSFSTVMYQGGA